MEKWDLLDEKRRPLNKLHNRGNQMSWGKYHTVVEIWTVNDNNEILLTLRHPNKEEYPNLWENTGGSVLAGETSRQGAVRELFEETGIRATESELAYLGTSVEPSAFVDMYAVRKNYRIDELTMQEGETSAARWVTKERLDEMIKDGVIAYPVVHRLEHLKKEFMNFLTLGGLRAKKYILFDLDGTLTDSAIGITNSVMYSLKRFNIEVSDRSELYRFVGPPLQESFERYYGLAGEQVSAAIAYYREYYRDKGIYENEVYSGIVELLRLLKEKDKTLIVATSKPEYFARQVISYFNLEQYFTFIAGSELNGIRVNKDEVIAYVLEECRISDLSLAVLVGDRKHDVMGAKSNMIDSIGVLYGYGNLDELQSAGATYIVEDVNELTNLLIS